MIYLENRSFICFTKKTAPNFLKKRKSHVILKMFITPGDLQYKFLQRFNTVVPCGVVRHVQIMKMEVYRT